MMLKHVQQLRAQLAEVAAQLSDEKASALAYRQEAIEAQNEIGQLKKQNAALREVLEGFPAALHTIPGGECACGQCEFVRKRDEVLATPKGCEEWDGEINPADFETELIFSAPSGFFLPLPRGVRVTHVPTGTIEECFGGRSQRANLHTAFNKLVARLDSIKGGRQCKES